MRKFALAGAFMLTAMAAQAEGISGVFQTQANDDGDSGLVQFAPCGNRYCGTLVKSFNRAGVAVASDHEGRNIVWDMVDDGNGRFSGGKIRDPGADKTYASKMTLKDDTLKVSGCISVICRSQAWTRVR